MTATPPTLYVACPDDHGDGYETAREEHILAQPCVIAALAAKKQDEYQYERMQAKCDAEIAKHPEMRGKMVRQERVICFTGTYEDVARQVALSYPAGRHTHRVVISVVVGEYEVAE